MVVYVDVLFFVNFIINYMLLYLTAAIAHIKPKISRLTAGAALGALYAVLIFLPDLKFGYTAVAKFLFSMGVVAVAYNIRGVRLYIKALGIFYLVTFACGGGVMALFQFANLGASLGMVIKNGVFYIHLPWHILFLAIVISYVVIRFVWGALQNRLSRENMYVKVGITLDGKEVWLDALLDTGNSLCDPLSNAPVIVAEYEYLRPILPPALLSEEGVPPMEDIEDDAVKGRLRMIPFSSLGKEHGMLVGFRPDRAIILENEQMKDAGNVVVGMYTRPLARDRSYAALLHPTLLSQ